MKIESNYCIHAGTIQKVHENKKLTLRQQPWHVMGYLLHKQRYPPPPKFCFFKIFRVVNFQVITGCFNSPKKHALQFWNQTNFKSRHCSKSKGKFQVSFKEESRMFHEIYSKSFIFNFGLLLHVAISSYQ